MDINICVFGDSISWGAADDKFGGWAGRLNEALYEINEDTFVYNCGVISDNTDRLLKRFKTEAIARQPNLIIFGIGINDSQYYKNRPRTPIKKFLSNLKKLSTQAKKITNKIIFLGLTRVDDAKTQPIPWHKDKFYNNQHIQQYDFALKNFCLKNNLKYLALFDLLSLEDLDDGLHPTTAGHEKIFKSVKEFLINNKII